MGEYTDTYVTMVLERLSATRALVPDAKLKVETQLDLAAHVPEAFGTADAIIVSDDYIDVIDFKYGKGVKVDAYQNTQMMIYALGAYDLYSLTYNIKRVRMTIIQPRLDNLSHYEMTIPELLGWADKVLHPAALAAYNGQGEQQPGAWCRFCKIKSICRKLADVSIDTPTKYSDAHTISAETLAHEVLPLIDTIKSWCSSVEEHALNLALSGTRIEGYKVVEGRSNRRISDKDKVESILFRAGFERKEFIKPSELISITDLEKLVGKKNFSALCGEYITKPHGKPTLVVESDKRPPYDGAKADFDGIEID